MEKYALLAIIGLCTKIYHTELYIMYYTLYYTPTTPLTTPYTTPITANLRTTSLEDGGFLNGVQFAVRVGILALTMLTFGLVWWYQELERRLLVVRHHLSSNVSLMCSPLMTPFTLELIGKVPIRLEGVQIRPQKNNRKK